MVNDFAVVMTAVSQFLGSSVYSLRAGQISDGPSGRSYRIYPIELTVKEIRLGDINKGEDESGYGPGVISLLCQNTKGLIEAFSPVEDDLISKWSVAGRNHRAFFNKEDLKAEAEILKDCILKTYKNVCQVEVQFQEGFFDDAEKSLDDRLDDAVERSELSINKRETASAEKLL